MALDCFPAMGEKKHQGVDGWGEGEQERAALGVKTVSGTAAFCLHQQSPLHWWANHTVGRRKTLF